MDIRLINGDGDIMNASRLHITVRGNYLVGLTEDMNKEVLLERCKTEEEALANLDGIKGVIKEAIETGSDHILINFESKKEEADGK